MTAARSKGERIATRALMALARGVFVGMAVVVALLAPTPGSGVASGQSVLERPPNMSGSWSGRGGTVYFNVMHRFTSTGPPLRKVINYPMLLVGAGIVDDVLVAARYSTNSELVPRIPNEWEFFARYRPFEAGAGFPVTMSGQAGYNHAGESFDGELSVEREVGRVLLLGAGRVFTDAFAEGETRFALAGGAAVRLTEHIALAGDYARLLAWRNRRVSRRGARGCSWRSRTRPTPSRCRSGTPRPPRSRALRWAPSSGGGASSSRSP